MLDILCAYLRRPAAEPDDSAEADPAVEREHQVRSTAQRLISDLLPWGQDPDQRVYHLDLTGARLEHLYLSGRRIGRFTARDAHFHGITRMVTTEVTKPALLTRAEFHGRVDLNDCRFEGGLSLEGTSFTAEIALDGASVGTFLAVDAPPPDNRSGYLAASTGHACAARWDPGPAGSSAVEDGHDYRRSTRDVDAVFLPAREVHQAADRVAEELDLPEGWLNDAVKGFLLGPIRPEPSSDWFSSA